MLAMIALVGGLLAATTIQAVAAVHVVDSGSYFFTDTSTGSDTQIVITAGDQIAVRILDDGEQGARHTVDIPAFDVQSQPLDQGEVYTTPPLTTPGTYEFFCRTHRSRGHTTTLIVQPDSSTTTTTTAPSTTVTTTTTTSTLAPPPTTTLPPGPTTSVIPPTTTRPTTAGTNPSGSRASPTQAPGAEPAPAEAAAPPGSVPGRPGLGASRPAVPQVDPIDWSDGLGPQAAGTAPAVTDGWIDSVGWGFAAAAPLALLALYFGRPRRPPETS